MSTFASQQDVERYIEGWVTDDPFALERLIQRAERDIERVLVRSRAELPPTQVISVPGATGGTYTISWTDYNAAVNSAVIPAGAGAATLQASIQAWSSVGVGEVIVLGTNPFTVVWNVDWTRSHFVGQNPGVSYGVPLITIDSTNLQPLGTIATVTQVPGRKLDPLTDLDANQALALANATCAQVEYRNHMGSSFFIKPQYQSVKGPDFATVGKLPYVAPKAKEELSQVGLILTSGRAIAGWGRRGINRGWPSY